MLLLAYLYISFYVINVIECVLLNISYLYEIAITITINNTSLIITPVTYLLLPKHCFVCHRLVHSPCKRKVSASKEEIAHIFSVGASFKDFVLCFLIDNDTGIKE